MTMNMPMQADIRSVVRDLNTPCVMPKYRTKEEWLARAADLRLHILVSCGLYPSPIKCPLNPQIFGKVQREGYTVEKVYFESYPGFLVTGNLYRPAGKRGRLPGVLSPHGHWHEGRFGNDPELGSVPGRCINLALQGYVVFSYDMVGYNDSSQISHTFGGSREALWGLSLMGLQLWNSLRSVDFLSSLPDVDPKRIACTGESGGGTQTFMLMAVEPRIACAVPVNMISAHFQGGCLCENAPNLRLETFNVEIAALMAPRPMLMVSATGDWTKDTPRVEYPAVRQIYRLLSAEDRVACVQFDAPHNYNKDSREAMYAWFGRWLLGVADKRQLKEKPFTVERAPDVLVFYGRQHPRPDVNAETLTAGLVREARNQLEALKPTDRRSLSRFRKAMEPALRHALGAQTPNPSELVAQPGEKTESGGHVFQSLTLGRRGQGDSVPATLVVASGVKSKTRGPATLVVHPQGQAAVADAATGKLLPIAADLLKRGGLVLTVDCFGVGRAAVARDTGRQYFTTYNRTDTALRVQDILTALAYLRSQKQASPVNLIGLDEAGLGCLLARGLAPFVKRCVGDAARFDASDDAFLRKLFVPGLRRAGDVYTAAALAAPKPLFLHNTGKEFDVRWMAQVYRAAGAERNLQVEESRVAAATIVDWIAGS